MSSFANVSGFDNLIIAANTVSDGYLIYAFVVVIFAVTYLYNEVAVGKNKALIYASFLTGCVLLPLNLAGLVQYWMIVLDGVLFTIGLIMMVHSKPSYE